MLKLLIPVLIIIYYFVYKDAGIKRQAQRAFEGFNSTIEFLKTKISGVNDTYDHLFLKYGQMYGVDPKMLKAISLNESWLGKYKNKVTVNGNTTGGLMHIELPTARDYIPNISASELVKPENEIKIAAMHVKTLSDAYNGNIELIARAYNGGMGRVQQFLEGSVNSKWLENTTNYYERYLRNYRRIS